MNLKANPTWSPAHSVLLVLNLQHYHWLIAIRVVQDYVKKSLISVLF